MMRSQSVEAMRAKRLGGKPSPPRPYPSKYTAVTTSVGATLSAARAILRSRLADGLARSMQIRVAAVPACGMSTAPSAAAKMRPKRAPLGERKDIEMAALGNGLHLGIVGHLSTPDRAGAAQPAHTATYCLPFTI